MPRKRKAHQTVRRNQPSRRKPTKTWKITGARKKNKPLLLPKLLLSRRLLLLPSFHCNMNEAKPPLILTLQLNKEAFHYFNALRKKYFPKEKNFIDAHLTLFHHLPFENFIIEKLQNISKEQNDISLLVSDVVSIGKGTAIKIKSVALCKLHKQLQVEWQHLLTPQDKQRLWPHVTIQNKVTPQAAKDLFHYLSSSHSHFNGTGIGMQLWKYQNGPWEHLQDFAFSLA